MSSSWTFGKKLGVGFGFAGLVLAVIAIAGYFSTHRLIENDRLVSHTHQVRREVADLLSLLKDAETGQRGYVITGDQSFLEPYTNAVEQTRKTIEHLRTMISDNSEQVRRLEHLIPVIDQKYAELKRTIEIRNKEGFEATSKVMAAGLGKKYMDDIRSIVAEIDRQEQELLAQRDKESEMTSTTTKGVVLWGGIGGLALIGLCGWYIATTLASQIGTAVHHIQSSSTELQAAANQQTTGAREQSTAMNEITTTISELLATSRQIAESAQRVAQIAEQTASNAKSGDRTVERARDSILGIRRQVDLIVNHMLELGKKSQQIGAVLDIVSELAEQTNILAINATIEAAGAGEAGKRFAVVADEIRKLADRVGGATKDIRSLIDDVRSAVNTTVMATETGSKAVDVGSKNFGEVTDSFTQIGSLVSTTTEAAQEIEMSTKQQSTAVEQVNIAIANVAQATRETEASSGQTMLTASQLAALSKDLLRLVQPQAA